jgi:hypothetical protein
MIRTAAIKKSQPGRANTQPTKWLPPVKGFVTAVPQTDMPPDTSPQLTNWFPEAGYVRSRNGCVSFATGFTESIDTLVPFYGATDKLFAISNKEIFDVTSAGAAVPVFGGVGGSGLTATATISSSTVASITVTNGGAGYTSAPTVAISGGGGTGATALATVSNGIVIFITMTNVGSGYTTVPTVTLTGGGGTGATAVANVPAGGVSAIAVTAGGTGFTSPPIINLSGGGGGSGATAVATVSGGAVTAITVTNAGSNYTAPPTVSFSTLGATVGSYSTISSGGGNFIFVAFEGGEQAPLRYDGTTWSPTALSQNTGFPWPTTPSFTPTNLSAVVTYGSSLFFVEENSTHLWVGPTLGVAASLQLGLVDVGPNLTLGGTIAAIAPWNMQTVYGPLQHIVIISTNGECLIFQGTDPTNSANWGLLATFRISPPLGGQRGLVPMGADLSIMTIDGIISVSKAFSLDPAFVDQAALTAPISPTWLNTMNSNGITNLDFIDSTAWALVSFPHKRMLIANIPDENGVFQYVMNTETNAWTMFSGWLINCAAVFNNVLYYGGTDVSGNFIVFQAETGGNDNGQVINCLGYTAWDFGDGMTWRAINTISCIVSYTAGTTIFLDATEDYQYPDTQNVATSISASTAAVWDTSLWDVGTWGGLTTGRFLAGVNSNPGFALSVIFKAQINGSTATPSNCIIFGGSYAVENGGFI